MERYELLAKIQQWTGLDVVPIGKRGSGELWAVISPTGVKVAELTVGQYGGPGWEFGGCSSAFPDDWKTLCRINERSPSREEG